MSTRTHQLFFISKALSLQRTFSEGWAKESRRAGAAEYVTKESRRAGAAEYVKAVRLAPKESRRAGAAEYVKAVRLTRK